MEFLNRLTNNTNPAGIVLLWLGTMTNDIDSPITDDILIDAPSIRFEQEELSFEPLPDASMRLDFQDSGDDDEERTIVAFANKFLSASRDIEPEINAVVQKDLWEIL